MKAIRRPDQYLRLRGDIWHYVRRVPKAVSHIDDRTLIYRSLETDSRKVARQRRDIFAYEDELRWSEAAPSRFKPTTREAIYRDVSHNARSLGFNYEPMESLISRDTVTDLLHRLQALGPLKEAPEPKEERDADSLVCEFCAVFMTVINCVEAEDRCSLGAPIPLLTGGWGDTAEEQGSSPHSSI